MPEDGGFYLELTDDQAVVGEELIVSGGTVTVELPLNEWLEIDDFRGPPGPRGPSGPPGGSVPIVEIPTGVLNGANEVFHTSAVYVAGSTRLHLNGIANFAGINYTETGGDTLTLSFAPLPGDLLIVEYLADD